MIKGRILGVHLVDVLDHFVAPRRVEVHAGHHEDVGDATIEAHLLWTEVPVPLLQDNPCLVESGIDHGRANGAYARRHHPHVGVDEREDSRAVIEGTGDDGRQIVLGGNGAKTTADVRHFTGCSAICLRQHGEEAPSRWLRIVGPRKSGYRCVDTVVFTDFGF